MMITYTQTVTVEGGRTMESSDREEVVSGGLAHKFGRHYPESRTESTDPILSNPVSRTGKATGYRAMVEDDILQEQREKEAELGEIPRESPAILPTGWVPYQQ